MASCCTSRLSFWILPSLSNTSTFPLMNLFRIFKNRPRHHQASDVPTASSTSSYRIDSEILVQGADPITAEWVPPYPAYRYTSLISEWSIVFVHGLHGHRRDTWTKDNVCWPQDLLSKEESLSHIRVLTLGYDANILNIKGRASLNTLFQHSINLVQELSRVRRKDAVSRIVREFIHNSISYSAIAPLFLSHTLSAAW